MRGTPPTGGTPTTGGIATTGRTVVSVLGPTRIDGVSLTGHQRALIATLALRRGVGVSTEQLIDAVWLDAPPRAARQSLHNQIGRLRRRFGRDVITTDLSGYHLAPQCDAEIFGATVLAVLAQDPSPGDVAQLDTVLSSWVGTPYADLDDDPLAEAERARLLELHARAIERRAEARMLAGEHARAVVELTETTTVEPYRESGWGLLIDALRLDGRKAEALTAFDRAARHLAELGAVPSDALLARRRQILGGQRQAVEPPRGTANPLPTCPRRREPVERRWCVPAGG